MRSCAARNLGGDDALDHGCSTGAIAIALATVYRGALVTGLDADLHALVLAQRNTIARGAQTISSAGRLSTCPLKLRASILSY